MTGLHPQQFEGTGPVERALPAEVAKFKNDLDALIKRTGLTQDQVANRAGITGGTVSKALSHKNRLPTRETSESMVRACLAHIGIEDLDERIAEWKRKWEIAREAQRSSPDGEPCADGLSGSAPDDSPGVERQDNRNATRLGVILALAVLVLLVGALLSTRVLLRPDASGPELGLDLVRFCTSYGLTINDETCVAEIDLTEACKSEHRRDDLKGVYRSDDPHSGECLTPENRSLGGIREMTSSACGNDYPTLPVIAVVLNRRWVCSLKIDMNIACIWQYSRPDLKATKDKNNIWSCR